MRGAVETWTGSPTLARTVNEVFFAYVIQLNEYRDASGDVRLTQALKRRVGGALLTAHKDARNVVLDAAEAGLAHHEGKCLISPDPLHLALHVVRVAADA